MSEDGEVASMKLGCEVMVYAADAIALSPVVAAIACSVSVELTVMGPLYWVEDVVGVVPSVV